MTKTEDPPATPTEQDQLQHWREQRLQELGYHHEDAELWAGLNIDWHQLATLIDNGCPPDLAIHILA